MRSDVFGRLAYIRKCIRHRWHRTFHHFCFCFCFFLCCFFFGAVRSQYLTLVMLEPLQQHHLHVPQRHYLADRPFAWRCHLVSDRSFVWCPSCNVRIAGRAPACFPSTLAPPARYAGQHDGYHPRVPHCGPNCDGRM